MREKIRHGAMSWKESYPEKERVRFIARYERGEESLSQLCREAGISRKTAYKWIRRYQEEGPSKNRGGKASFGNVGCAVRSSV